MCKLRIPMTMGGLVLLVVFFGGAVGADSAAESDPAAVWYQVLPHASIHPDEDDFDLGDPDDIETVITWGAAAEIVSVELNGTPLDDLEHYTVTDIDGDTATLTILESLFVDQAPDEGDELVFSIEFDVGDDVTLTVSVVHNEPDPPTPPATHCELTIEVEGEGTTDPEPGTHTYRTDRDVIIEATPYTGWAFHQWLVDYEISDVDEPELTVTMDDDRDVTAVFVQDPAVVPYVSEIFAPDRGGVLHMEDLIHIDVPPEALRHETEVQVEVLVADSGEVCLPAGPVDTRLFRVSAHERINDERQPLERFAEMVEVTLHWEEELETADAERILVHYCNVLLETMVPLPTEVDVDAQTVTTEIDRPVDLVMCIKDKSTDIHGHWGERYILLLSEFGAISGYPDFTFRPDELVNREEFARMLVDTAGVELPRAVRMLPVLMRDADDVSYWAKPYVEAALLQRLIAGYDDDTFRPDESATRAQVATMLSRALNLTPVGDPQFADADEIPDWAAGHVAALSELDIIRGYLVDGEYYFRPDEQTIRAEVSALLTRYLGERLRRGEE